MHGCDGWRYRDGGSVNGMTPAGLTLIGVPANSSGAGDGVARPPSVSASGETPGATVTGGT